MSQKGALARRQSPLASFISRDMLRISSFGRSKQIQFSESEIFPRYQQLIVGGLF